MGKTILIAPRPASDNYIPYEKSVIITENRAPTDDSVRIFDEMRDAAHKAVISTITVNDNTVNMKAVVFAYPSEMCHLLQYSVKINGLSLEGQFKVELLPDRNEAINFILKKLSARMAEEMLASMMPAMNQIERV